MADMRTYPLLQGEIVPDLRDPGPSGGAATSIGHVQQRRRAIAKNIEILVHATSPDDSGVRTLNQALPGHVQSP